MEKRPRLLHLRDSAPRIVLKQETRNHVYIARSLFEEVNSAHCQLGLIGTGLLALPVLGGSAAYADLMEDHQNNNRAECHMSIWPPVAP